jgi:hypothetical protein
MVLGIISRRVIMRVLSIAAAIAAGVGVLSAASVSRAALYSNDFDSDTTSSWTVNNNGVGTNDANFFFDYGSLGISNPSGSGSTRGLRLRTNIGANPASGIAGISASPTGESFSGTYRVTFDYWSNYLGPLGVGAAGSTEVTNFGVLTSGTTYNGVGAADGVFFSATGDGQNGADFRAYSSERTVSYQVPGTAPEDEHANHLAGSRNNTASYYATPFPGGNSAPLFQQTNYTTQSGTTSAGATGFQWNKVQIDVTPTLVTWTVNGTPLITVDTSNFTTPTGGNNILFGMSDTNTSTNTADPNFATLQFSVIDNVVVDVVPEPVGLGVLGIAGIGLLARRRAR